MWDALLGLFLVNGTLLITHEIDSVSWKEWERRRKGRPEFRTLISRAILIGTLIVSTAQGLSVLITAVGRP